MVMDRLEVTAAGLTGADSIRRRGVVGSNAVRSHHARAVPVLLRQLRSPLLVLLALTAGLSFVLGERTEAVVIGIILTASVGLGFANEYRAERAAEALHDQMRHRTIVLRDGAPETVDVVDLVPGDIVELQLGQVVPADLRLLTASSLECEESLLTGEALPAEKSTDPAPQGATLAEATSMAWMGTVVSAGLGQGVMVATGAYAEFGRIAVGLGERQPETAFQVGLRRFSLLLVKVAAVLTAGILAVNVALHRPALDALLFSLAIAVGITPQLLPAVVSTSLAAGTRQLARAKVLVKRLISIEVLGDIEVLFTDKTGTLTQGRLEFMRALGPNGSASDHTLLLGLLCTQAAHSGRTEQEPATRGQASDRPDRRSTQTLGTNPLDAALWTSPSAPRAAVADYPQLGLLPFDHERRLTTVLVRQPGGGELIITKGAPEAVLARCGDPPPTASTTLEAEFAAGHRVVAVASRETTGQQTMTPDDESALRLDGFLVFSDPPRPAPAQR